MMPIPDEWWTSKARPAQTAFAAGYAALNLVYLILAIAGLRAWYRRGWHSRFQTGFGTLAFAMIASILLRLALLLTLDNSEPRYTLEFFPILFVWAGALFPTSTETAAERSG
jgi:uncharacterized membrane protein YhfC